MINHHEMANGADPDLPEEVLAVLPTDPYEQLDVARKITAMAVASRLSRLEAESGKLRQKVSEKDHIIYGLQERIGELEETLQETNARLSHALDEQAKLTMEKNALAASVKKLSRDNAKLETFKRTLMQSLQEDEENPSQLGSGEKLPAHRVSSLSSSLLSNSSLRDTDFSLSRTQSLEDDKIAVIGSTRVVSSNYSSVREDENHSEADGDALKQGIHSTFPLTPTHLTPQLTPTGSPKKQSAAGSPRQQSATGSPRRQSTSASPKQLSAGEGRASFYLSQPASLRTTAPNSPPGGSLPARTPRVDGKEFFRQARNRLSYEQFSAFLANIKELNAHRQTREETLRKADEIFGADNKDLHIAFDGLLSRHLPAQG